MKQSFTAAAAAAARRLFCCLGAAGLAGLAGACQPDEEAPERIPQLPQLEQVPAAYRRIDQTDTLDSYWAPDSLLQDTLFQFTRAHRRRLLMQAQFLPASELRRQGLATLTFRPKSTEYFLDKAGYEWGFSYQLDGGIQGEENEQRIPTHTVAPLTTRLVLTEYLRRPEDGGVDQRHAYIMDYPFLPLALAKVNDSVVYVRAYLLRVDVRQPDAYYLYPRPRRRQEEKASAMLLDSVLVPHYADLVDSSRVANIRFSFRTLPAAR